MFVAVHNNKLRVDTMIVQRLMKLLALVYVNSRVSVRVDDKGGWSSLVNIVVRRESLVNLWILLSGLAKDVLVIVVLIKIHISIHVNKYLDMR